MSVSAKADQPVAEKFRIGASPTKSVGCRSEVGGVGMGKLETGVLGF